MLDYLVPSLKHNNLPPQHAEHEDYNVKATAGLDIYVKKLTKHSSLDGNKKGDVTLGNPTLPEDLAEIAGSPAQTIVLRRTLARLYPLNK